MISTLSYWSLGNPSQTEESLGDETSSFSLYCLMEKGRLLVEEGQISFYFHRGETIGILFCPYFLLRPNLALN